MVSGVKPRSYISSFFFGLFLFVFFVCKIASSKRQRKLNSWPKYLLSTLKVPIYWLLPTGAKCSLGNRAKRAVRLASVPLKTARRRRMVIRL